MRRFRRLVRGALCALGPVVVAACGLAGAGLALHAAADWHHHGAHGAGFFHLHVHLGDHHHEHGDHHAAPPRREPSGSPNPEDGDEGPGRPAVLTVVQALQDVPGPSPAPVSPGPEVDWAPASAPTSPPPVHLRVDADPRGPPAGRLRRG